MVLRKPYAILIKYFKLIHLVQCFMLGYLLYLSSNIHNFLTQYLESPVNLITPSKLDGLFNFWLYAIPIITIIAFLVISYLMKIKKKPILFYILIILSLILNIIFFSSSGSVLRELEIRLLDIRTLKIIQDLTTTSIAIQAIMFIQTLIRATGFDIKKFDFNQDLEELEINESDNEEFEVNVELEKGKWKRKLNKIIRVAKYGYKENKLVATISIVIIVLGIVYFNYHYFFVENKIYKEKDIHSIENIKMSVQKSYKTHYTIKNKGDDEYSYVIANINLNKQFGKDKKFPGARIYLQVGRHQFYHISKLDDQFYDLGNAYKDKILDKEIETFAFIYKIPNSFYNNSMYITFDTNQGKEIRTKIEPIELDLPNKTNEYKLKDELNFKGSLLLNSTLKIDDYQIDDVFTQNYKYCPTPDNCYPSVRYVIPLYTSNYTKSILKLSLDFNRDENLMINNSSSFIPMINSFGKLSYKIDGKVYSYTSLNKINTKINDGKLYIEVKEEIKNATDIWFDIEVRNKKYKYILKEGEL